MKAIEILQGTKQLLQDVGWCQGQAEKIEDGKVVGYCLIGAWYAAIGNSHYEIHQIQEEQLADTTLNSLILAQGGTLSKAKWNDAEGRTKEQVIGLLDQAIQQLSESKE